MVTNFWTSATADASATEYTFADGLGTTVSQFGFSVRSSCVLQSLAVVTYVASLPSLLRCLSFENRATETPGSVTLHIDKAVSFIALHNWIKAFLKADRFCSW